MGNKQVWSHRVGFLPHKTIINLTATKFSWTVLLIRRQKWWQKIDRSHILNSAARWIKIQMLTIQPWPRFELNTTQGSEPKFIRISHILNQKKKTKQNKKTQTRSVTKNVWANLKVRSLSKKRFDDKIIDWKSSLGDTNKRKKAIKFSVEAHSWLISSLGLLTIRPWCRRLLEPVHFPVLIPDLLSLSLRPVWKKTLHISLGTK